MICLTELIWKTVHGYHFVPCKGIWIPESAKFLVKSGIREKLECGILGFGIRNTALRIRNPTSDWNPEQYSTWGYRRISYMGYRRISIFWDFADVSIFASGLNRFWAVQDSSYIFGLYIFFFIGQIRIQGNFYIFGLYMHFLDGLGQFIYILLIYALFGLNLGNPV